MAWPTTNVLRKNAYSALNSIETLITNLKEQINVAQIPPLTKAIADFVASEESTQDEKTLFQNALDSCSAITTTITNEGL